MTNYDCTARRLSGYLDAPLSRLRVLASGWETTIFEFALASPPPRAPIPAGTPLVLRSYEGSRADQKGAHESAVLRRLATAGYRAPRPYLLEPDHGPLGAPFLIMERLAGGPLFAPRAFARTFATFAMGFCSFVRCHAALHRLAVAGFAADAPSAPPRGPSRSLLARNLDCVSERIEDGPLPALRPALEWARAQAGRFAEAPESIVHLDYHPQNAIVRGMRVSGIVDWVNADAGDRHLDAAMTTAIMQTSAMERPRWMRDNIAGNTLRRIFALLYVPLYHALAPLDFERLRYCQAVAALGRLSMLGMMHERGAETVGFRPEALREVTPQVIRLLSSYLTRKSGVGVRLDRTSRSRLGDRAA